MKLTRTAATVVAGALSSLVVIAPVSASAAGSPTCPAPPPLPRHFVRTVTNPHFPLKAGTTYTYHGRVDGQPTVDVFTVTHGTKRIVGVRTTVIHDRVFMGGDLVEDTLDWYAQDSRGNVWYFGEDTKELHNGTVTSTQGSWQAGVHGARPGMFMPAHPRVGQVFKQEDAPGVAEDCTRIADLATPVSTPYRTWRHALKTEEFSLLEPGVLDNKYYVRHLGEVREQTVVGGDDVLSLVNVKRAHRSARTR
jgi:hypothetical protein